MDKITGCNNNPSYSLEDEEREEIRIAEYAIKTWNEKYKGTDKEYKGTLEEALKLMRERAKYAKLE